MRVAAHRRDNYKLTGLKRVRKQKTITDLLNGHDEAQQDGEKAEG
jgi:hypothetical protein